jgi:predicted DNA-binding protein
MKIRMNVFLDPEQKQVLEKLSAKTGAPVAELIRRAVDAYLKRGKRQANPC